MGKPVCRNCGDKRRPVNRPRGLCWTCYYTPGVRERVGVLDCKFNSRGLGSGFKQPPLDDQPTKTLPGTFCRQVVMMRRARAGQSIFHPLDAKHEVD